MLLKYSYQHHCRHR